jgi:hypothetical protein
MIDAITTLVTALTAGATAALKPTAESAVKDTYNGLKDFLKRKFGGKVALDRVEEKPSSEMEQKALAENLAQVGADKDKALFDEVEKLIAALKEHAPDTKVNGINITNVEAEFLQIKKAQLKNGNFTLQDAKFQKGIDIGEISIENEKENP